MVIRAGRTTLHWMPLLLPEQIQQPSQYQPAEGGGMIIPVGKETTIQELVLIGKNRGRLVQENIIPVRFVPML